jgi:site-specific DNA-cytosine methylase
MIDEKYYLTKRQLSVLNLKFDWKGEFIISHKGGRHQQDIIYNINGKMSCLSSATHGAARHLTKIQAPNKRIRRLTEIECERLQTVPDNYTEGVSSSKRYEMLGNGFTVDVVAWILGHIK